MILAERELSGYPGVTVELHVDFEAYPVETHSVIVRDSVGEFVIHENGDRSRAKDAYFHPFAFGYKAPATYTRGV